MSRHLRVKFLLMIGTLWNHELKRTFVLFWKSLRGISQRRRFSSWAGLRSGFLIWSGRLPRLGTKSDVIAMLISISGDRITSLCEGTDGDLWVATWGGGLNVFRRATRSFEHFRHDPANPNSLAGDVASTILEDQSGTLWVGHWGQGLDSYDPRTGLFRHFRHNPADPATLCGDMVHSLCQTSDTILWVGTWGGGLDRLNLSTGRFTHFRHEPGSRDGLSDNVIMSLLQSSDGTLWVGTWNGGLSWSHQADGVFHSSTTSDDPYRNVGFSSALTALVSGVAARDGSPCPQTGHSQA